MNSASQIIASKPWSLNETELLSSLQTKPSGLTYSEAKGRLALFGVNDIEKAKRRTIPGIFLNQYKNPLILILIGVSITSFFLGDKLGTGIILVMLFINSFMGFFQEYGSEKAVAMLRRRASLKASVIREGKELKIAASDLVPGDIVKIEQGNVVPADIRLIKANNLLIDEAVITGESFPAEKTDQRVAVKQEIPTELTNIAFMGTNVETGEGVGVVFATASFTEFGKTAHALKAPKPETEFQIGVRKFGKFVVVVILSMVVFIFLALIFLKPLLFHIPPNVLEALLFSLALAIGITPELLPIIITINLSRGAVQMSKKHVIVKELMAIEDIGNADILCTDKTGTITEGKISLEDYLDYQDKKDSKLLLYGLLSNTETTKVSVSSHPLETALAASSLISDEIAQESKEYQKLSEIPFDFERKRNSVLLKGAEGHLVISKGATEQVLKKCSHILVNGKNVVLGDSYRENLEKKYISLSSNGYRLLAVAAKKMNVKEKLTKETENDLTFYGFLLFSDRPKESVSSTIAKLSNLSVTLKIITGDNEYIARHICEKVGLAVKGVVVGETIDRLTDEELAAKSIETTIFARVTPEHKQRIISAVKRNGHTVAFLGDGANDAPALKTADVGISVETALDVAKEAADIILLRPGLDVIINAVEDGRRTFGNSMKYIFCVSSSNFGNMFSLAGASLLIPFVPMLPAQVILLNFMGDIPSLAISTDNVDAEYLRKPKHWDIKEIGSFMVPFGLISSIFDFATFFLMLYVTRRLADPTGMFRAGWFIESLATEILVIYIIRTHRAFWNSRPSRLLLALGLGSIAFGWALVFSPLAKALGFVAPPLQVLGIIGLMLVAYLSMAEIAKRIYYRKLTI